MLAKQPKTEARDLSYGKVTRAGLHGTSIISQIQSTNALEQVNTGNGGIENTDVLGYSELDEFWGPSFREWCGKWFQSKGNVPNVFMCAIPTPTTIHPVR